MYEPQAVLWSTLPNQKPFQSIRQLNVDHGIYLIYPHNDYCEFFAFASTCDHPEVVNFYLNNLDVLQKFTHYFKERASKLLQNAENNKIVLPYHQVKIQSFSTSDLHEALNAQLNPSSYQDEKKISLSQRQTDCVNLLLTGATSKEIAMQLNLSYRTVEDYINSLKQKFNARNKVELILKLITVKQ